MSIWTLASEGQHDLLVFGSTMADVEAAFGAPTERGTGRLRTIKYDNVELHFIKNSLYLIQAEVWAHDEPATMLSDRLRLEAGEVSWPLDVDAVAAAARQHGVTPRIGQRFDGLPEVCAGLAVFVVNADAGWIGWSVSEPTSGRGSSL